MIVKANDSSGVAGREYPEVGIKHWFMVSASKATSITSSLNGHDFKLVKTFPSLITPFPAVSCLSKRMGETRAEKKTSHIAIASWFQPGLHKQCNIKISRHRWKSHLYPWTTTGAIVGWQRFRRTRWWQQRFIWIPWNFDQRFESRKSNTTKPNKQEHTKAKTW